MRKLQRGDVFDLKNGMQAYAKIPERYVYANRACSLNLTETNLTVGEELTANLELGAIGKVCKALANTCQNEGYQIKSAKFEPMLRQAAKESAKLAPKYLPDLVGEYVVIATDSEGGGTGMGSHDVYPYGWRVTARRLKKGRFDPRGKLVSFYQTGCFNAMNPNVPVKRVVVVNS